MNVTPRAAKALRNRQIPTSFAKPLEFYDRERGLYIVTDGVASTGQEAPDGTVTHTEHRSDSARLDAEAAVRTVMATVTPDGQVVNVRAPLRQFDPRRVINGRRGSIQPPASGA